MTLQRGAAPVLVENSSLDDSVEEVMALPLLQNSPDALQVKTNNHDLVNNKYHLNNSV